MRWSEIWNGYRKHLPKKTLARLFWLGLAMFFVGIFVKLTWELHEDSAVDGWDKAILLWVADHRVQRLNGSAVDVTALGSPIVLLLFTVLGGMGLAFKRDWPGFAYLVGGSAGAGLITYALKHVFTRPRPEIVSRLVEVSGYSYPSGHSLAGTSFYLLVMFLAWRAYSRWAHRIAWLLTASALIVGIGFSRVYLGVHNPSDVLSGILLGASWSCVLTSWFF
jgi:undecaprenyl-diphosphatase